MSNFFKISLFVTVSAIFFLAFHKFSYQNRPFFYFLVNFNDKLNHIVAFMVLAFLIEKAYNMKNVLLNSLILLSLGAFIEIYQLLFVPGRSFSLKDFLADCVGIAVYIIIKKIHAAYKKRKRIYKIDNLRFKTLAAD